MQFFAVKADCLGGRLTRKHVERSARQTSIVERISQVLFFNHKLS
jgi:hypothetical protein